MSKALPPCPKKNRGIQTQAPPAKRQPDIEPAKRQPPPSHQVTNKKPKLAPRTFISTSEKKEDTQNKEPTKVEDEYKKLKGELKKLEEKHKKLKGEHKGLRDENENLRKCVKQSNKLLSEKEEEMISTGGLLGKLNDKLERRKGRLDLAECKRAVAEKSLTASQGRIQFMAEDIRLLIEELKNATHKNDVAMEAEINRRLEPLLAEGEATEEALKKEIVLLKATEVALLAKGKATEEALKKELKLLEAEKEKQEKEFKIHEQYVKGLEEQKIAQNIACSFFESFANDFTQERDTHKEPTKQTRNVYANTLEFMQAELTLLLKSKQIRISDREPTALSIQDLIDAPIDKNPRDETGSVSGKAKGGKQTAKWSGGGKGNANRDDIHPEDLIDWHWERIKELLGPCERLTHWYKEQSKKLCPAQEANKEASPKTTELAK